MMWNRLGGWLAAAKPRRSEDLAKLRALDHVLDQMAQRVAEAELRADREASIASHCRERAMQAEAALVVLQNSLNHARLGQTL